MNRKRLFLSSLLAAMLLVGLLAPETTAEAAGLYTYRLAKVIQVAGRQGVATDGDFYYVSGSKALYKYTKKGELITKNEDPFRDWCPKCNHLGDIDYYKGEIYTAAEEFREGRGWDIQIAIYDAKKLKFLKTIRFDEESGQVEASGVAVDPLRKIAWMSDWTSGRHLYQYDLTTGKYIGKLRLHPAPQFQQGVFYYKGKLFITADDGDADFWEPDNLYRVNADPSATHGVVEFEKAFNEFIRVGEIEGLCFDRKTGEFIVHHNRGKHVVEGIPVGLYPGYKKEVHELYIYEVVKP